MRMTILVKADFSIELKSNALSFGHMGALSLFPGITVTKLNLH